MALWFRVNINFYCTQKNDIALGASASCNIIFLSAIKIDIALTQVPYLYSIKRFDAVSKTKSFVVPLLIYLFHCRAAIGNWYVILSGFLLRIRSLTLPSFFVPFMPVTHASLIYVSSTPNHSTILVIPLTQSLRWSIVPSNYFAKKL